MSINGFLCEKLKDGSMRISVDSKRGITLVELILASAISVLTIAAAVGVWSTGHRIWLKESAKTGLRVEVMAAVERLKHDMRRSSLTYMSFYPSGVGPHTAVSMPVVDPDSYVLLPLNAEGNIDWDRTIIYHVVTGAEGAKTLCRTVFDPRDNTMTNAERYTQLSNVVADGNGGVGSTTDTGFLENLVTFELSPQFSTIDFYDSSVTPVRVGRVNFGAVNLSSGTHTIRFEVTGKNDASSGYYIGLDAIMLEPAGSLRDVEYYNSVYAPFGALTLNSGTVTLVNNPTWNNDNYLEFAASGVGSYMQISDYYDLWRESSFENAAFDNVNSAEAEVRITLDTPAEGSDGDITWFAYAEAGDSVQSGADGVLPGGGGAGPVTLRTVVTQANIAMDADLVRVSFRAPSTGTLLIDRAYITKKAVSGTSGASGLPNQDPTGLTLEEYHRHQQLFFRDSLGDVTAGVVVPAGTEEWSVWTAFPLRTDSDYVISLYISDAGSLSSTYWQGTATHSYYMTAADNTRAGTPDWSAWTPCVIPGCSLSTHIHQSHNVYVVANIDAWDTRGTVTSKIFDTTKSVPVYNEIKWAESLPSGTDVLLRTRSSAGEYMTGAASWSAITPDGTNPHSLALLTNARYIQFQAELSSTPFWESGVSTFDYPGYVAEQASGPAVYDFPVNAAVPYITTLNAPWVDDVEIDWPAGTSKLCTITGYIAKKSNYGQAKITVDGEDLTSILNAHVKTSTVSGNDTIVEEKYLTVEPQNTGN